MYAFALVMIGVVRQKILSMTNKNFVTMIIRNNSFQYVNQSESLRIAFAMWLYSSQPSANCISLQLICICSEKGRSQDEFLR